MLPIRPFEEGACLTRQSLQKIALFFFLKPEDKVDIDFGKTTTFRARLGLDPARSLEGGQADFGCLELRRLDNKEEEDERKSFRF